MPPKFDQQTERRILKAAARLWKERGEEGLTLRAVAKEAGTSTPTVYKRFRDRKALRLALAREFYDQILDVCVSAPSLEETWARYIQYAREHPHEYRLLWDVWADLFRTESPRLLRTWVASQFAKRYGGKPEEYVAAFFALLFAAHGAAMLLTSPGSAEARQVINEHFPLVAEALVTNPQLFRK